MVVSILVETTNHQMDLTCTTPTLTNKTSDSENDTPPPTTITTHSLKPLSFKNHHLHHHQSRPRRAAVMYKECLKNHAASIGGHAVDGCGEFMPSSSDSLKCAADSLKCAACGCHRNFHRRQEPAEEFSPTTTHFLDFRHHILPPIRRFSPNSPSLSPPPPPLNAQPVTPKTENYNPSGRKRFRTKFTQEQKEKMHIFSEKLGWKLQKCDEIMVDEFCNEVGVGKSVLRVWMHNNKNTFGKKDYQNGNNISNGFNINDEEEHQKNNNDNSNCGLQLHISTNGSSSSS